MSTLQLISATMTEFRVYLKNLHFLVSKEQITWELYNWGLANGLVKIVLHRRGSAVHTTFCSAYLIFSTAVQANAVIGQWNGVLIPTLGPYPLACQMANDQLTAPSKSKPTAAYFKPAGTAPAAPPASFAAAPRGCGGFYRPCPVMSPHNFPPPAAANISAATQLEQPKSPPPVPPPNFPPPPCPPRFPPPPPPPPPVPPTPVRHSPVPEPLGPPPPKKLPPVLEQMGFPMRPPGMPLMGRIVVEGGKKRRVYDDSDEEGTFIPPVSVATPSSQENVEGDYAQLNPYEKVMH